MDPTIVKTIAIAALFMLIFVVLPIVALMLEHQRKMVRLLRGESVDDGNETLRTLMGAKGANSDLSERVAALEAQVASLTAASAPRSVSSEEDSVRELLA